MHIRYIVPGPMSKTTLGAAAALGGRSGLSDNRQQQQQQQQNRSGIGLDRGRTNDLGQKSNRAV